MINKQQLNFLNSYRSITTKSIVILYMYRMLAHTELLKQKYHTSNRFVLFQNKFKQVIIILANN